MAYNRPSSSRNIHPPNTQWNSHVPGPRYAAPASIQSPAIATVWNNDASRQRHIQQGYRPGDGSNYYNGPSANVHGGYPGMSRQPPLLPIPEDPDVAALSSSNQMNGYDGNPSSPQYPLTPMFRTLPLPPDEAIPPNGGELTVEIAERTRLLDWGTIKRQVKNFLECYSNSTANTLKTKWPPCEVDREGCGGSKNFKKLFDRLNERTWRHKHIRPIYSFKCISLSVPCVVRGSASMAQHVGIDLHHASNLEEFFWKGDFFLLGQIFMNIPPASGNISILNISGCVMSVSDTVAILHSCPQLKSASLGKVDNTEAFERHAGNLLKASELREMAFPDLSVLEVTSNEAIGLLLMRLWWKDSCNLVLNLGGGATDDVFDNLCRVPNIGHLTITGRLSTRELWLLRNRYPPDIFDYNA